MEIDYKTWLKIQEADNKPPELEAIKKFKESIKKFDNLRSVEIKLEQ